MYVNELIDVLERINIQEIAVESINETKDEYLHLNKGQIWDGKTAEGTDITPSYLDDPFFKTRKQAEAYANWKWRITGNPRRNKYTPNLFINGYFYSSIKIDVASSGLQFDSWKDVGQKYEDVFGLIPENQKDYNYDVFLPVFAEKINELTGLVLE